MSRKKLIPCEYNRPDLGFALGLGVILFSAFLGIIFRLCEIVVKSADKSLKISRGGQSIEFKVTE